MYSQFKVINVQQLFFPFYFDLYPFRDMYWGTVLFYPFSNSPPSPWPSHLAWLTFAISKKLFSLYLKNYVKPELNLKFYFSLYITCTKKIDVVAVTVTRISHHVKWLYILDFIEKIWLSFIYLVNTMCWIVYFLSLQHALFSLGWSSGWEIVFSFWQRQEWSHWLWWIFRSVLRVYGKSRISIRLLKIIYTT